MGQICKGQLTRSPSQLGERAGPRNLVSLMVFSLVLYSRVTQSREAISERKACELNGPFVQSVSMNTIEIAKTNHNVSVKASPEGLRFEIADGGAG